MLWQLLLLTGSAVAQDRSCEVVDEVDLRGRVLQLQAAIDRGDADTSHALSDAIFEQMHCVNFAPDTRLLADYLVARAVDAFAAGDPWQPSLTRALALRPSVDRSVSAAHPLAKWQPPPSSAASIGRVPLGVELYVDGLPAAELPPAEGLHLVQRRFGRFWSTMWVQDAPVSSEWLLSEVEGPRRLLVHGELGLSAGAHQESLWDTFIVEGGEAGHGETSVGSGRWCSDTVPGTAGPVSDAAGTGAAADSGCVEGSGPTKWVTVHLRGTANLWSSFAFVGEASHVLSFARGFQGNISGGIAYQPRRIYGGGAVGLFAVRTATLTNDPGAAVEAGGEAAGAEVLELSKIDELAYPMAIAGARGPTSRPWSAGMSVGARTQFFAANGHVSYPVWMPNEHIALLVGGRFERAVPVYALASAPEYRVRLRQTQAALEFSLVTGER